MRGVEQPVRRFGHPAEFADLAGTALGESQWHEVTPDRVAAFAAATAGESAAESAAGSEGPLVLAMLPSLLAEVFEVEDLGLMVITGVERARYLRPAPAGTVLRLSAGVAAVEQRARGTVEVSLEVSFDERDGAEPLCRATVGLLLRPARPARRAPVAAGAAEAGVAPEATGAAREGAGR
jgi:acyl dehydratase